MPKANLRPEQKVIFNMTLFLTDLHKLAKKYNDIACKENINVIPILLGGIANFAGATVVAGASEKLDPDRLLDGFINDVKKAAVRTKEFKVKLEKV